MFKVTVSEFPSVAVMRNSEAIGRLYVKDSWRWRALNFTVEFRKWYFNNNKLFGTSCVEQSEEWTDR
jgi:hypothetical protein